MGAEGFTQCRSIASDPLFDSNGYFYVCGIVGTTDVVVRRYKVSDDDTDVADPDSRTAILTTMPAVGHLAGWIGFANDGMLDVTTGDGSPTPTHDPENDSQNAENLIGKVLRIDVRSDDFPDDDSRNYAIPPDNPYAIGSGSPEIQAIGFRNPWRASFDRLTGGLWVGDVAQNNREDIDFIAAGDLSMKNFGWRLREGSIATPTGIYGGPGRLTRSTRSLNTRPARGAIGHRRVCLPRREHAVATGGLLLR